MDIDLYTWLILSALAAFRLAELLVIDDGPWDVFSYLRGMHVRVPFDNSIRRQFINVLQCVHCAGFYLSVLFAICYFFQNVYIFGALFALAIAGLQSILAGNVGRK